MGFSAKQVAALRRNVEERYVRSRESNGKEFTYIEGWYAIAQANRIFGFDGWNRETVESKCVLARENRGTFLAVYTAKVRVTVHVGTTSPPVVREGHGTGEGRGATPGEVHDTALKAAETDATKRALATFGRPFGLELYRGQRENKRTTPTRPSPSLVPGTDERPCYVGGSPEPKKEPRSPCEEKPGGETRRAPMMADALPPGAEAYDERPSPISSGAGPGQQTTVNADSLRSSAALPPDDTSPVPRPSRYFGRKAFSASRERTGALMQELARTAESAIVEPETQKIDKSVLTFGEPKRIRDKAHLRFVGSQPCLVCGRQPADAHHLRFAQPRALGRKVSDEFTVPLCRGHHRQVHQAGNEAAFWEDLEINALEIAKGFWEQSRGLTNTLK